VGTHLVDEYQAPRIDASNLHAPERPQELVSFCRPSGSFFRLLRRHPTARQTVASLTLTPDTANKNSALSLGVGDPRPLLEVLGARVAWSPSRRASELCLWSLPGLEGAALIELVVQ
jgi:hypothetical protein